MSIFIPIDEEDKNALRKLMKTNGLSDLSELEAKSVRPTAEAAAGTTGLAKKGNFRHRGLRGFRRLYPKGRAAGDFRSAGRSDRIPALCARLGEI